MWIIFKAAVQYTKILKIQFLYAGLHVLFSCGVFWKMNVWAERNWEIAISICGNFAWSGWVGLFLADRFRKKWKSICWKLAFLCCSAHEMLEVVILYLLSADRKCQKMTSICQRCCFVVSGVLFSADRFNNILISICQWRSCNVFRLWRGCGPIKMWNCDFL